jgi:hypothetical protein
VSLATLTASFFAIAYVLVKLPADFFLPRRRRAPSAGWFSPGGWARRVLKNLLGGTLVAAGVLQLVTPGQGILTVLIGVALLDFPGKRRLEGKLLRLPRIFESVNRLRARFGQPPLKLPEKRRRRAGRSKTRTHAAERQQPKPNDEP